MLLPSQRGGHLVTISNAAENAFVSALWFDPVWIGMTDAPSEGTWHWINGQTFGYSNWDGGEPNDLFGEDYGEMYPGGLWNDLNGLDQLPYIIEFDCLTPTQIAGPPPGSTFPVGSPTTISYIVEDGSGNTAICSFTVTVEDDEDPTIDCTGVQDYVIECSSTADYPALIEAWITAAKATILSNLGTGDNCDPLLTITDNYEGQIPPLSCNLTNGVSVTFTVTDIYNNSASCTFTVYVDDSINPTIDCSEVDDLVLECVEGSDYVAQIESWIAAAKVTILNTAGTDDACDTDLSIDDNYDGSSVPALNCDYGRQVPVGLQVTFTVMDECGNMAQCTKTVYLVDTQDPTIDCSSVNDLVIECGPLVNDYWPVIATWIADAEATILADPQTGDGCDGILDIDNDWDGLSVPDPDCDVPSTGLEVHFTVTDDCGNTTTCTKKIYVVDTTDPVITVEASSPVYQCGDPGIEAAFQLWLAQHGGAQAYEACSGLMWTYSPDPAILSDGCGETGSVTVTFTAEDGCGHTASSTGTFTIIDNIPPVFTNPLDYTLFTNTPGTLCPNTGVMGIVPGPVPQGAPFTVAGKPFNAPMYVDPPLGPGQFSDACSIPTLSLLPFGPPIGNGCNRTYVLVWKVTDACGNMTTQDQVFQVIDNTPPVLNNVSMDCSSLNQQQLNQCLSVAAAFDPNTLEPLVAALYHDQCNNPVTATYLGTLADEENSDCSWIFTYNFEIEDFCGNPTFCSVTYSGGDTEAPVISPMAQSMIVECDGLGNIGQLNNWLNTHGGANATDNCDTELSWGNDFAGLSDLCGATGSATVHFTVTDNCNHTSTTTATFTIEDTQAPVFTDCDDPTSELIVNGGFETGDLSSWTLAGDNGGVGCDQGYQVYSGNYDGCGFSFECGGQNYTPVEGNFGLSAAIDGDGPLTREARQLVNLPAVLNSATLSFTEQYYVDLMNYCSGCMTRMLDVNILDAAGTTVLANVHGHNFMAGSIYCQPWTPHNLDVLTALAPYAGTSVMISYKITVPENFTGPAWYAVDDISLEVGSDGHIVTLGCNPDLPTAADAISAAGPVMDICDADPNVSATADEPVASGCDFSQTWTVVAEDECENASSCEVTYTWRVDTQVPVLACPEGGDLGCNPPDLNFDGIPDVIPAFVSWTDNCVPLSGTTYVHTDDFFFGGCNNSLTRVFSYTDACGNTGTCSVTYTWSYDPDAPFVICPLDIIVEGCGTADIMNGNLTALAFSAQPTTITDAQFFGEGGGPL
jgi:hypothetical protein